MANSIWKAYPKMGNRLDQTTKYVHDSINIRNQEISYMLKDLTSGGKMLRPAFFWLFTSFGPEPKSDQELLPLAASLELLHVATLVHDDVIDDSPLRRSRPTIHTRYGKRNAIYAGDYLFTLYFQLISQHLDDTADILTNAISMENILQGELDQLTINFNVNATVKMYLREVSGKTAELFSLSTKMGATVSGGDPELINRAKNIGHNVGMAFQIIDDVLDFSSRANTGKPNFEDLRNGVYTLPYILGLQAHDSELVEILSQSELSDGNIYRAAEIVAAHGYLEQAQQIARTYSEHALKGIAKLPPNDSRKALQKIVKTLVKRLN